MGNFVSFEIGKKFKIDLEVMTEGGIVGYLVSWNSLNCRTNKKG